MATIGPADSPVPGQPQPDGGAEVAEDPGLEPPYLDLEALEARSRELLPQPTYDYYAGGAETETTMREATAAWRSWRLRPRVLRGVTEASLATELLGAAVGTPIGIAPWAYQAMAHPDGELATARAAAASGALMTVSTSANNSLEEVAEAAPGSPRWFQLYRLHSDRHTEDLARRAGDAGYQALVLTVDVPVLGRRRRDMGHDFVHRAGVRMANRPPEGEEPTLDGLATGTWTFDAIARFGEVSGLPVVVKGILRGDDAVRCVQAGAAAVWVTTHGGRQADPCVASAHALPEVVDAVGDDAEVYADGGIRSGSDVLTALALGASAVFLGRPIAWGLTTGGERGVAGVIDGLTAELAHAMVLCGLPDVRALPRDTVTPAGVIRRT
ncbi:alpha-hydroxy acid oxidase [Blastococcus xanthinilyticus]|uniref:4-hydroxymandelate oxidase n=1 Tax=Blastococcus xanthinilyticus TaxID=1564164 RepID=A0A5S5CX33_9ACTN|nr:alpha-hydroxy acid oxidase [Blastococcus xanthinilyticus]TYP88360.1 4-hydroxymandelate oxidase [Blastococcus xanthinilyticus]